MSGECCNVNDGCDSRLRYIIRHWLVLMYVLRWMGFIIQEEQIESYLNASPSLVFLVNEKGAEAATSCKPRLQCCPSRLNIDHPFHSVLLTQCLFVSQYFEAHFPKTHYVILKKSWTTSLLGANSFLIESSLTFNL